MDVVETLPYSAKSVDLTPLASRLKSAGADVVLQTSYQNDTVLFFRQMKEQGDKPNAVIGAGGGYSLFDTMKAVGAEHTEGALDVYFTQYRSNPAGALGLERVVKKYQAKYGIPPRSGHSLANYMWSKVFVDAMEEAKDLSGSVIRDEAMKADVKAGATATGWGVKFHEKCENERAEPFLMHRR